MSSCAKLNKLFDIVGVIKNNVNSEKGEYTKQREFYDSSFFETRWTKVDYERCHVLGAFGQICIRCTYTILRRPYSCVCTETSPVKYR